MWFSSRKRSKLLHGLRLTRGPGARSIPSTSPSPPVYTTPQAQEVVYATPVQATRRAPTPEAATSDEITQSAGVCDWCGEPFPAGASACSRCGAMLKRATTVAQSGWVELPGRKDMAKLQFGNSFVQIEGAYVPVADFNLAPEDSVYFTHHVLLWKDASVVISSMSLSGGWKRLFAGLPLIMTQAQGPGHIAFSQDTPGELLAIPIHPGQEVDVKEHLFLAATGNVNYDYFPTNVWFSTRENDETDTKYPVGYFMDRFRALQTPGLLLLHAHGNVFIRNLGPNETILIKPGSLIFKDPTVQMHLHFEDAGSVQSSVLFFSSGVMSRHMWLRLIGPGRVAVQSVFAHDHIFNLNDNSPATQRTWNY